VSTQLRSQRRPKVLMLCHRIPFPPNKGDKVRSFHWLQHLAKNYDVHLGALVDDPSDWQYQSVFERYCASWKLAPVNPRWARVRSALSLLGTEPLSLAYFRSRTLQRWVEECCGAEAIDAAFVFSSPMAQYVMDGRGMAKLPIIADLVDVDSAKWAEYANTSSPVMAPIYRREGRTLLAYEGKVCDAARASLFVSEEEASVFRSLRPETRGPVIALPNGVDTAYFDPDAELEDPFPGGSPPIVFTGAMDYRPNVEAVTWFAKEVMPLMRRHRPDLCFYIVGSRPSAEVCNLACESITVTGTVDDIRPYLRYAGACIAPMRIARGVQNKVLEAMSMARPVVVSRPALEGIRVAPDSELLVADSAAEFVDQLLRALSPSGEAIADAARRAVLARFSWTRSFDCLDEIMKTALCDGRTAGAPNEVTTEYL